MVKSKSILLIGWFFYPKLGGVESVMLEQAEYLTKGGWNVSILTSLIEGLPSNDHLGKVKIYRRDYLNSSMAIRHSKIEVDLNKILEKEKPNIIHFHNGSYIPASTNINAGVNNVLGIFNVIKSHDLFIIDHAHNAQLKKPNLMKKIRNLPWDYMICVSKYTLSRYQELGFKAKKFQVINNGIDLNNYNVLNTTNLFKREENEVLILFPSRVIEISSPVISQQKNIILVLKACQILLKNNIDNFKLIVVLNKEVIEQKKSKAFEVIRSLIELYQLKTNIVFVPNLPRERINEYYQAVDIVCVPSINENYSLTYLETMAAGKIPIGSESGGTPEIIKNNYNGFLVDPINPNDLFKVLKKLLTNKKLIKKISVQAKNSSLEHSLEKSMQAILKIYSKVNY